jgi:hypothetical protein
MSTCLVPKNTCLERPQGSIPHFGWRIEQIVFFIDGKEVRVAVKKA